MSPDEFFTLEDTSESISLLETDSPTRDSPNPEKKCVYDSDDTHLDEAVSSHARRKLICAAVLSVVFMVVELIGGYMAGSLAVMGDAAHLLTDSLTFIIGAAAITWARRPADDRMNFGYKRVEVFCAIISIFGIWVLTLFILFFASQRLMDLDGFEIDTNKMLGVAALGVVVNIVMAGILHGGFHHNHSHGGSDLLPRSVGDDAMKASQFADNGIIMTTQSKCSSENINVQAAFLHVLGDFLQSIGVVIAAVVIKIYPEAKVADPLITFLFSIIVVCTTLKIFKRSAAVLLEAVPAVIPYEKLMDDLENVDGVSYVHDLRIWSLSDDFHCLTAHIVIIDSQNCQSILSKCLSLTRMHGVHKATIQIEIK